MIPYFDELDFLYNHRIQRYPTLHNINKNTASTIKATGVLIINKGNEVVIKEKLKYPLSIRANLFSVSFPCFFNHPRPATIPIKTMKLNTTSKLIACFI